MVQGGSLVGAANGLLLAAFLAQHFAQGDQSCGRAVQDATGRAHPLVPKVMPRNGGGGLNQQEREQQQIGQHNHIETEHRAIGL